MKRGSLLRFLGIWASSITSIFAAHALAKSDIKDLTKTSKKMRPSQAQNAPEESAQDGMPPVEELQDLPSDVADRYPWKKDIVTTTFWIGEKPTQNNPVPNHKSTWDAKWAENYGGTDTPDRARRTVGSDSSHCGHRLGQALSAARRRGGDHCRRAARQDHVA